MDGVAEQEGVVGDRDHDQQGARGDPEHQAHPREGRAGAHGQDRERINVNQDYELRDWAKSLNTTPERLKEAVQAVGAAS